MRSMDIVPRRVPGLGRLFPLALIFAALVLGACANAAQGGNAGAKSFAVLVSTGGLSARASSSRGVDSDASVASVYVELVQNYSSVIGSGQMTQKSGYWQESFDVSSDGSAVVNAVARDSSGKTLYTGSSTITILDSGTTALTLPMSAADYAVGDTGPAGGIIFYDQGSVVNGWRYMEASPSDQSSSAAWNPFNDSDSTLVGTTQSSVGSGKTNTADFIGLYGASGSYAAQIAAAYSLNSYSDWFLPSTGEIGLMWQNLYERGRSSFPGDWYWSSTDYWELGDCAYAVEIWNGNDVSNCAQCMGASVRAIREF